MPSLAGYPYVKAEFDKHGKPTNAPALPAGITDVIIVSHGWNNNAKEAQSLYDALFTNFAAQKADGMETNRTLGIVGVFWPSKKFDESIAVEENGVAGGAVSLTARSSSKKALAKKLKSMRTFLNTPAQQAALKQLEALLPQLEDKATARAKFVQIIRTKLLDPHAANKEDASTAFFKDDPEAIMKRLRIASTALDGAAPVAGGATSLPTSTRRITTSDTSGAAGLKEILAGFSAAAMNVLNFTTYYEMKARAGDVGRFGVAPLIDALPSEVKRVHLVGHSFGGRVVTSAAQHSKSKKIASVTLLQAAFSHNGFSAVMDGAFRAVVEKKRVSGPILVTHTKNDKAVGLAYPIASRLAGDSRLALGDENDKFGGLGRNGVQKMGAKQRVVGTLLEAGNAYAFTPGIFFNLEGSQFIKGHSDITGPQVAHALRSAIATT